MTDTSAGHEPQPETMLSNDGVWWWDGSAWLPALSPDGLWRWDGDSWRPALAFEGVPASDLAADLGQRADDKFALAGAMLSERTSGWRGRPESSELARSCRQALDRVREIDRRLGSWPKGDDLAAMAGHLVALPEERRLIRDERERLAAELRSSAVALARQTRPPTFKEADDVLTGARLLDDRAGLLKSAVNNVEQAEKRRLEAADQARRELAAAEASRQARLAEALRGVEAAEAEHRRIVEGAGERLQRVRVPGPGSLQAQFGQVRLHAYLLDMPDGRAPSAGAAAYVDTAGGLWRDHHDVLADLTDLGLPGTLDLHRALAERSDAVFLMIVGRTAASVIACPPGHEQSARHFAATLMETSRRAAADQAEREVRARLAEEHLASVSADRWKILVAREALQRVEADLTLSVPVDNARRRLNRAEAESPELDLARQGLDAAVRLVTTPPEPLRAAGT